MSRCIQSSDLIFIQGATLVHGLSMVQLQGSHQDPGMSNRTNCTMRTCSRDSGRPTSFGAAVMVAGIAIYQSQRTRVMLAHNNTKFQWALTSNLKKQVTINDDAML